MSYLVFGKSGWIGGKLIEMLKAEGKEVYGAESRLQNRESVLAELEERKPAFVLNAAGVTGRPNVDWCEDHKQETIRANVIGTLNLADCCFLKDIHMTNFATGCIFEYDDAHPYHSGIGFKEDDKANFTASFYSFSKGLVEQLIRFYPNVLTLRVRMPISDDLNPRNFITKISKYERVVNISNSMTVLHDLLPVSLKMAANKETGVWNFCNPGVISHNEILDLYQKYIDTEFKYTNFTLEEQAKILKAGRSNNELDCTKLATAYPEVKHISESIVGVFERMKVNLASEKKAE